LSRPTFWGQVNWSDAYQAATKAALAKANRELCFRINAYELRQSGFEKALHHLLALFQKNPANVHLVIDFQAISDPLPNIAGWNNLVPDLNKWRSFTVLSGAFPKDLSHLEKHHQYKLPRNDWLIWKNFAISAKDRIPSFGDYTIQHGLFEEREGKHFNFSASLRYTASEYWIIMRGEGVLNENGSGFAQFPAQAELLRGQSDFRGPQFSYGDLFIDTMAKQSTKCGSAKDWLSATFNHHLTFVVRQIEGFFASSDSSVSSLESNPSQHTLQA
jgi:hypothetical protein